MAEDQDPGPVVCACVNCQVESASRRCEHEGGEIYTNCVQTCSCGLTCCVTCFYKHIQQCQPFCKNMIELQYEAELQEEEIFQARIACALDPLNKTPGHEDRLPIVTASAEHEEESHEGVFEYAEFADTDNKDSKDTSDEENMSENMSFESIDEKDLIALYEHEDSLLTRDIGDPYSSPVFYDPEVDTYFDVADSAQDFESEQCLPISNLLSVCCFSRRSSRRDHEDLSVEIRFKNDRAVLAGAVWRP